MKHLSQFWNINILSTYLFSSIQIDYLLSRKMKFFKVHKDHVNGRR